MADKVKFELVSPEKILLSEEVDMVVVPGMEGNFGVLPGHAPLISSVRPGLIQVYVGGSVAERIFVVGGFAEVTPTRCTVLADGATPLSTIDRAEAEATLARAREALAPLRDGVDPVNLKAAEQALRVATARVEALGTAAH